MEFNLKAEFLIIMQAHFKMYLLQFIHVMFDIMMVEIFGNNELFNLIIAILMIWF